jgi:hydrogenase small subunit
MAQEPRSPFYDQLALRGVTRRDFLKLCGSVAALLGLSNTFVPRIAAAVESAANGGLTPTLWLNFGSCTGCTESFAQLDYPPVASVVLDILSVNYNETIMAAAGDSAEENIGATIEEGPYLLVCEGSVMKGFDGNTFRTAGVTGLEQLERAAADALAIVAVGSCAFEGHAERLRLGHGSERLPWRGRHRHARREPADMPREPRVDHRDRRRRAPAREARR